MPLLGGLPEIVTLHAKLCSEMSIVGLSLYCNANATLFKFDMSRPNSAFFPVVLPSVVASQRVVGFVASREQVLFVLAANRLLYRVEGSNLDAAPFPTDLIGFSPSFYNEPTDRLLLPTRNNSFAEWIGMESFWLQVKNSSASTGFVIPPATRDGLALVGFSAAMNLAIPVWMGVLGCLLVFM